MVEQISESEAAHWQSQAIDRSSKTLRDDLLLSRYISVRDLEVVNKILIAPPPLYTPLDAC